MEMKRRKIFRSIKGLFILALVFSSFAGLSNLSHFGDSFNTQELAQVPLQTKALFDGMYVNHTFTIIGVGGGPSSFVYTQISANVFSVSWNSFMGLTTWDVDIQNRIISNVAGALPFNPGTHDPSWIFTNVSLGDTVDISVLAEGDHVHNVSGETTANLPGFGLVDVWVLDDLTTPPGVLWFEKNSGILINGTTIWAVTQTFDFVDTNAVLQQNAYAPNLTMESVNPLTGNQTTQFNFSILYSDQDNNTPFYVNVLINGTPYSMEKQNPSDVNYIDGCFYQFLTSLQPGTYNYSFECSDGKFSNSTGTSLGPTVTSVANINPPTLTDGQVNPNVGYNASTLFTFKVNYTDLDNNPPNYVNVTINGTSYSMGKETPADNNFIDGCWYIYPTQLNVTGIYTYYFNCSDGAYNASLGPFVGPTVKKTQLFDGMHVDHMVTSAILGSGPSNFTCSYVAGSTFHVTWVNYFHDWDVEVSSRVMSNVVGGFFSAGNHDPSWIFNTVSLGDTVPIAVVMEAEHTFNISGELIYDLPGFGLVGVWVLEDLTLPGGLLWYEKSTGILLNGTFFFMGGSFDYTFDFVDTNVEFTYVGNDYAPELTAGAVAPLEGNQTTLFNFTVVYTDADDNAPSYINVLINGTPYPMNKQNPSDITFDDGCLYQYNTTLAPGIYNYSFECSDGDFVNSTGIYTGLNVTEVNTIPPQLVNPQVTPSKGWNSTSFNFTVTYLDIENNAPIYVNLTINTTTYAMFPLNPLDTNYIDGTLFSYATTLPFGNYQFQINCSDSIFTNATSWIDGPEVNPFYNQTILLLVPFNGSTNFNGWLNYTWDSLELPFGAVNYTLQISNTSDFLTIINETNYISETPGITSILVLMNSSGTFYWRVRPSYQTFNGNWSENFTLYIIINDFVPELSSGTVNPSAGNQSTNFNFTVNYQDQDNNSPLFVNVTINATSYSMSKVNISDDNYADGCVYQYVTLLVPGMYNYSFACYDGRFSNSTITFVGLNVTSINLFTPLLQNPQVSPINGINTTLFNFTVNYLDIDNNAPIYVNITINTTTYAMLPINPLDTNYTDGALFYYNTTLPYGYYQFQINCSDDSFANATGWINAPEVNPFLWTAYSGDIKINELSGNPDFIEFVNYGPNQDMTGWTVQEYYNDILDNTYTFPVGWIFNSGYVVVLNEFSGTDTNTTLYTGWNIPWVSGSIAVGLFDNTGAHVDWVQTNSFIGSRPADVVWTQDVALVINNNYAYRISDTDNDLASDWVGNQASGSAGSLNPGQTGVPPPPRLLSPLNGSQVFNGWINFTWESLEHPLVTVNYTLQISNLTDFSLILYESTGIPETPVNTSYSIFVPSPAGQLYWRVCPTYDPFNDSWYDYFTFTLVINDFAPELLNGTVIPSTGDQFTNFNFTVNYQDQDNNPPQFVNVTINGTSYSMSKVNISDNNYTDGCVYQYLTLLVPGMYNYSFACYDGRFSNTTITFVGLSVTETNLFTPLLQNPQVSPVIGSNTTLFNFTVTYLDIDNNAPIYVNITLNTTTYNMLPLIPLDTNYTDGALFYYTTTLSFGFYQFQINCSDFSFANATAWINTPEVNPFYGITTSRIIFSDDFEGGLSQWETITGLWHLTDLGSAWPDPCYSPTSSMWYGQEATGDYATGARTFGDLISVPFDLSTATQAYLSFYHWRQGEAGWDYSYVYITTNNASWDLLYQTDVGIAPWANVTLNISGYCGNSSVQVRFYFDTGDGFANNFRGWLVDDVLVTGLVSELTLLAPSNGSTLFSGWTNFTWSSLELSAGTVNYTLQISNTSDFSSIIYERINILETPINTTTSVNVNFSTGQYYWHVFPTLGPFNGNLSANFTFNLIYNEFAPDLVNGSVQPPNGSQHTLFNFSVTYLDQDNNPPLSINVTINGTSYSMSKANISDNNYVDGCVYQYSTLLVPGMYNYSFACYDGKFSNTTIIYLGPNVTAINLFPLILNNGQVNPSTGYHGITFFVFSVNYTDPDNLAPQYLNVTINSTSYAMVQQNPLDIYYIDGCIFIYITTLDVPGTYNYRFNCSDGNFTDSIGPYIGPMVNRSQLFDGMYVDHDFSISLGISGSSRFAYSHTSGTIFQVTWTSPFGLGQWDVDMLTRVITNSTAVYGSGTHAPEWIFTNGSIGDLVQISVIMEGDHIFNITGEIDYFLPGFGAVEVWVLEDLTEPGGVVWYEKSTGILLNGTIYFIAGTEWYTFDFVDTNVGFTYISNDYSPELTSGSVIPLSGNQSTLFNFSVIYTDQDNNYPVYINVLVNGTPYPMAKQNSSDNNYTDGCLYQCVIYLQPGNYNYSFECADWDYYNATGTYVGLTVLKQGANPPILNNGQVAPWVGYSRSPYTFLVNYSDIDNDAPQYINVTINQTTYSMARQDVLDTNYMDGCIYTLTLTLNEVGNYTFYFNCSDGDFPTNLGPFVGPTVLYGPLFDGMYINYTFTESTIGSYPSFFAYTYNSGSSFHVIWDLSILPFEWNVNVQNRIIQNSTGGFLDNSRTPAWIFTNTTLYDSILISVLGEGDHIFNVSGETIYYLPGFGTVEVWVLEDLTEPGGVAWYEKSTGVLLNGTFYYGGGAGYYIFDFVDTNVDFSYVPTYLTQGSVLPFKGSSSISYNFTVTYFNVDNITPTNVSLILDSVLYNMTKVNPLDSDYTDGVIYQYINNSMSIGLHSFSFIAYAGFDVLLYPFSGGSILGPNVTAYEFCALFNGQVSPAVGNETSTYRYTVIYQDTLNNTPVWVRVYVDGIPYDMTKDPSDNDFTNGVEYYYENSSMTFTPHVYYFEAYNSTTILRYPDVGVLNGPRVIVRDYQSVHTAIPPTIDGVFNSTEWSGAFHFSTQMDLYDLMTPSIPLYSLNISIWIMNDGMNIYICVVIENETYNDALEGDMLAFIFDNDFNRVLDINEHGWWMQTDPTGVYYSAHDTHYDGASFPLDISMGGTEDGAAAFSHTNMIDGALGDYTFEIWMPFGSLDSRDLQLSNGSQCGVKLIYLDYTVGFIGVIGLVPLINSPLEYIDPATYATLTLETPNADAPSLSLNSVTPTMGDQFTQFNFSVIYSDLNNNEPVFINVIINGTSYPMTKQNPADVNYMDGCLYQYVTGFSMDTPGYPNTTFSYEYSFECNDGKWDNSTITYVGPLVNITNTNIPALLSGAVSPLTGDQNTEFTFRITYLDLDNNAPDTITILINGVPHAMGKLNPSDINYTDGCIYTYKTTLSPGYHVIFFESDDGAFTNSTSIPLSITVTETKGFIDEYWWLIAIIGIIGAAVAVVIVTRSRTKKRRPAVGLGLQIKPPKDEVEVVVEQGPPPKPYFVCSSCDVKLPVDELDTTLRYCTTCGKPYDLIRNCNQCDKLMTIPHDVYPKFIGKSLECPNCKAIFTLAGIEPLPSPPPEEEPSIPYLAIEPEQFLCPIHKIPIQILSPNLSITYGCPTCDQPLNRILKCSKCGHTATFAQHEYQDYAGRKIACPQCKKKQEEEQLSQIISKLRDDNSEVRIQMAGLLGEIGDKKAGPFLLETVMTDQDNNVRAAAILSLGMIGVITALPLLKRLMETDPDPEVRKRAAEAIEWIEKEKK